jgi:hypothetical protein
MNEFEFRGLRGVDSECMGQSLYEGFSGCYFSIATVRAAFRYPSPTAYGIDMERIPRFPCPPEELFSMEELREILDSDCRVKNFFACGLLKRA